MGKQLALALEGKTRKRRRVGRVRAPLGRPPSPARAGRGFVPHVTREAHVERHPVHVTMRRVPAAPSFRSERVSDAIMIQLVRAGRAGSGIRVVHFSLQDDHLHLMLEGADAADLSRQAQKLFSRIALAVNAVAQRRGSLFRDRHHRRALTTPTEVRRALVYIMFNTRKHAGANSLGNPASGIFRWFDPLTSAAWFDAWSPRAGPPPAAAAHVREHLASLAPGAPVATSHSWLARVGWQRAGGCIRFNELPRIRA